MTFDLEKARATYRAGCAEDAANLVPDLIAEIERLRAALDKSEQILAHKTKTSTHWYEEGLQTRADLVQSKRVVEQQAAKIRELEDVHKRSGVKYAKIINELRSSVYANIPGLKKQWDEILNAPANGKNAPANGKIGPDATLPRSWQITDERKAAIQWAEEMAGDCKAGDALKAMLKGAEQE